MPRAHDGKHAFHFILVAVPEMEVRARLRIAEFGREGAGIKIAGTQHTAAQHADGTTRRTKSAKMIRTGDFDTLQAPQNALGELPRTTMELSISPLLLTPAKFCAMRPGSDTDAGYRLVSSTERTGAHAGEFIRWLKPVPPARNFYFIQYFDFSVSAMFRNVSFPN